MELEKIWYEFTFMWVLAVKSMVTKLQSIEPEVRYGVRD